MNLSKRKLSSGSTLWKSYCVCQKDGILIVVGRKIFAAFCKNRTALALCRVCT